jgi:putative ABC transport system permease protein
MYKYIPLAWIQLTYNKTRFIVAIAGIAFATLLMFMQLGFQGALYKTAIDIHENFLADIVLTGPRTENLYDAGLHQTFTKRYLTQALQIEGVDSVAPLYLWR